jgi:hypothetical protein
VNVGYVRVAVIEQQLLRFYVTQLNRVCKERVWIGLNVDADGIQVLLLRKKVVVMATKKKMMRLLAVVRSELYLLNEINYVHIYDSEKVNRG